MQRKFIKGDAFIVVVILICVELLKVLFIPNPFDVMVLGGLIFVLVLLSR